MILFIKTYPKSWVWCCFCILVMFEIIWDDFGNFQNFSFLGPRSSYFSTCFWKLLLNYQRYACNSSSQFKNRTVKIKTLIWNSIWNGNHEFSSLISVKSYLFASNPENSTFGQPEVQRTTNGYTSRQTDWFLYIGRFLFLE